MEQCLVLYEDMVRSKPELWDNLESLQGKELDGFNDELKLAFEYDGEQHYKYVPHFHRNGIKDFENQQERDKNKVKLCKENNINLIKIPYTYTHHTPNKLRKFIIGEINKLGYNIVHNGTLNNILTKIRTLENILETTLYLKSKKYQNNLIKLRKLEEEYNKLLI